jgi:hypothetical protein
MIFDERAELPFQRSQLGLRSILLDLHSEWQMYHNIDIFGRSVFSKIVDFLCKFIADTGFLLCVYLLRRVEK